MSGFPDHLRIPTEFLREILFVMICCRSIIAKGFLRTEVLGEVCVLEGGSLGRRFGEVFGEVFGLVLLGHSEQKKFSLKLHPQHLPIFQLILGGRSESLLRKPAFPCQGSESSGNCSGSSFCPNQVLLSKNFRPSFGSKQKFLPGKMFQIWVVGGVQKLTHFKSRHRVNGVGRGGGQAVFNQILPDSMESG